MSDSANAGWGVVLPSLAPKVGDIMNQAIARNDRRDERAYSESIRLQDKRDAKTAQNRLYNLKEIDADTDAAKYQTGEQAFDNYSVSELKRIKDNALKSYIDLDPAEMEYRLSKDMGDLIKWHGTVKDNIKNVNAQMQEFNKNYPNADAVKAHNYVYDNLAKDVMQQREDGSWERKPTEFIKPRDYTADLQKPEVLGSLINDTSAFSKHLNSLTKSPISEANFVNNKGFSKKLKWAGVETPYTDISPDATGMPQIGVKHQTIKGVNDADGKPMKFIDESVLKNIQGDPQAWGASLAMWQKEKPEIEAKLGRKLDPSEEDFRFKNFLYKKVDQYVPHGVQIDRGQTTPKPTQVRVSVNTVGGQDQINNVYKKVSDIVKGNKEGTAKFTSLPFDVQSALTAGINKEKYDTEKMYVQEMDDGRMYVMYPTEAGDGTPTGKALVKVDYVGTNIKAPGNTTTKPRATILKNAAGQPATTASARQAAPKQETGNVKVSIDGKTYEVPKSALGQMKKDGVKFKQL